jgi:hypothetical protein
MHKRAALPDHSVFSIDGVPCRQIALSDGQFTIVCDSDYAELSEHLWQFTRGYAYTKLPKPDGGVYFVSMQRVLLGLQRGEKLEGDHINGFTLDNRRSNLRSTTKTQNSFNTKLYKNNKTGFKGVSKVITAAGTVRYVAQGRLNGKVKHLGQRDTPEEAHLIYAMHARQVYEGFIRENVTMSEDDLPWGLA